MLFLLEVFFKTSKIVEYDTESIMGYFMFLGVTLMTHTNDKT